MATLQQENLLSKVGFSQLRPKALHPVITKGYKPVRIDGHPLRVGDHVVVVERETLPAA